MANWIKCTMHKRPSTPVYINLDHVVGFLETGVQGTSVIYAGDDDSYFSVSESAEEIIKKGKIEHA
ncbi:MAG: hypothetical protein ACSHW2_01865 [Parasphingopyxis sp.]